jgi:hypothetical protein
VSARLPDPLVVTTRDAGSWWKRAVDAEGHGLYARADCTDVVPELRTIRELAVFGLSSMPMDCLPVPVGPTPPSELDRLRLRVDEVERAYTFDTASLQRRIDGLEQERHETNESLNDAVQELRARIVMVCRECAAPVRWVENENGGWWNHLSPAADGHSVFPRPAPFVPRTERSYWEDIAAALNAAHSVGMPVGIDLDGTLTDRNAWSVVWDRAAEQWAVAGYEDDDAEPDAIARAFVPVQVLRERPGEFEATLRHAYATPHDMPAPGSCGVCGSAPETWCPNCAACQKGCHDGFVNNPCTHANASWGGA